MKTRNIIKSQKSMINIILGMIVFIMVGMTNIANAQVEWETIYTEPNNMVILDIHSFNEDTLIAVGESGTIMKSIDGGSTWTTQNSGTSYNLYDIECINLNNYYVCGLDGTILHTIDGGSTWTTQNSGTSYNLLSITFIDQNNGYICGYNSTILHTIDGGSTWTTQNSGVLNNLINIKFITTNNGYICGWDGAILHTIDGGSTWTTQNSGTSYNLLSITFIDQNNGYICGADGAILHTIDGGSTWTTQNSVVSDNLYYVQFINDSTGWISGSSGIMLYTHNKGYTWYTQSSNTSSSIYALEFTNDSTGWAGTLMGEILHTETGGMGLCEVSLGNNTDICEGTSLILDAQPGYDAYNWSTGTSSQTFNCSSLNTGNNEIIVEVSKTNGCLAKDTILITVNANPSIELGIDSTACASDTYVADAGPGFSNYEWNTGDNSQSIYIDSLGIGLNNPTNFSVTVTDVNGCTASDNITITFDVCSKVNTIVSADELSVYPNPSNGIINIQNIKESNFSLINSFGQTVYTGISSDKSFNISNLPNGIYFLKIEGITKVRKIIKR